MNRLKNGGIAVGAPGSIARELSEVRDALQGIPPEVAPKLLSACKDLLAQLQKYEPKTVFAAAENAIKEAEKDMGDF